MLTSILLIVFNKAALSYYSFGAPNVLTLAQNVCSLVLLVSFRRAALIDFHAFSTRNLRKMVPLGLTFILYMVLGMIAMKVVNIPMYTTLRRTTVVFVMALEWFVSRKSSSLSVKAAVGLMLAGALLAGANDLNFELLGYAIVMLYNAATAAYLVLVNHLSAAEKERGGSQQLKSWDFMFYNNLISIPLLLVIIACTGETAAAWNSPHWSSFGFHVSLFCSSVLAFVLNYAIFWNTAVNSALTQTVSGQAKDIVVVALGFALFDDAHVEAKNIAGVTLGFAGSIVYACSKIFPWCTVEYQLARLGIMLPQNAAPVNNGSDKGSHHLPFTVTKQEDAPMGHSSGSSSKEPLLTSPQSRYVHSNGGGSTGHPVASGPAGLNYSLPNSVRLLAHLPQSIDGAAANHHRFGSNSSEQLSSSATSSPDPLAHLKAAMQHDASRPYARGHDATASRGQ